MCLCSCLKIFVICVICKILYMYKLPDFKCIWKMMCAVMSSYIWHRRTLENFYNIKYFVSILLLEERFYSCFVVIMYNQVLCKYRTRIRYAHLRLGCVKTSSGHFSINIVRKLVHICKADHRITWMTLNFKSFSQILVLVKFTWHNGIVSPKEIKEYAFE